MSVIQNKHNRESAPAEWLKGGGQMGDAVREFDWARTPLGPRALWPQSLRVAVGLCLNSRYPMFMWWGPELVNVYNDAYIPVLGKRHPGALGGRARELWKDVWPAIAPQVEAVFEHGEASWQERMLLVTNRNGYEEDAYFTYSHSPVFDEHGDVLGLICVVTEQTANVQAEADLRRTEALVRQSEERLSQVFTQAPVAVAVLRGEEMVFELANAAYEEFVPGRKLLGRPLREALPELGPEILSILERVFSTGEPYVGHEFLVPLDRDLDGVLEDHWYTFVYQPWKALDGSVVGIVIVAVEVSAHVQARQELERVNQELRGSQIRLHAVIEQMPSGLFLVEAPSGKIVAHNAEAERLLGHPAHPSEDYRNYNDYGAVHPDGTPYSAEEYPTARALLKNELIRQERMQYRRGDGTSAYLAVNAAPVFDDGRMVAAVCTFHDITEQEQARERLRASEFRQAYLLKLSDATRPLYDPHAVKAAASRLLGEELRVNRALYAEVDGDDWIVEDGYTDGVEPLVPGRYAAETYGHRVMNTYRAGENIVFRDTRNDAGFTPSEREAHVAIKVLGAVGVPLLKDGKLVAVLVVHTAEPRDWTAEEIQLVEETAERTWAAVQRAKTEAALRKSEAKYRSLFDSIDQGFCLIEMLFDDEGQPVDYRFCEVNPSFEQQTGLRNALGRTARELVPELEQHWFDIYGKVALTGESVRFINYSEPMGRWFEVYAFRSGAPENGRVALLFSDITFRKQTEDALSRSEERLRTFVTTSSAVVWTTDATGSIVEKNASVEAFTGRSFDQYKGWGWLENIHPDDREQTGAIWKRALETRSFYDAEYRLLRHDGVYRHVIARGAPVLEPSGALREWVGTCTDIHDRVEARRKLEFLNSLAEATRDLDDPAAVMIVTTRLLGEHLGTSRCAYADVDADTEQFTIQHDYVVEGVTSTAGQYQLSLFGPRAADDQRNGRTLIVHDVDRELASEGGAEMFNAIGIKAIVCCPLLKQGQLTAMMAVHQTTPRLWTTDEVELVEETVERAWAYIERSRARRTLQESNDQLARTNRELEEFAYVASHDLQEPLRMVSIYSELLTQRFGGGDPRAEEYTQFIHQGTKRMETLLRDLLSYSRTVQRDEQPVGTADLDAALREAEAVLLSRIDESGAVIEAPPLPKVCGDTQQLSHVFQNLLSNALKYRKKGISPRIEISSKRDGKMWVISVRDNGIGFEPQYSERIFGLFKRLHKDEYPGTGLGLAICQRTVERYGGRMWAEGRLGEGATFYFTLPATEAQ